jgi:hypothetical protein
MNSHPSALARKLLASTSCLSIFAENPKFTSEIKAAEEAALADFYITRMQQAYQNTMQQVGCDVSPSEFFYN